MQAKLFGHRIHPMLIPFPIGLLGTSVVFDVVYLMTDQARWAELSFWLLVAGVISGLIAAPFGTIDWLGVPKGTRAKAVGLVHAISALSSIILFALSGWLRYENPATPGNLAIGLAFWGVALLLLAGWLGGELVERLGIGVDAGAHPNSPSSLSNRPAHESKPNRRGGQGTDLGEAGMPLPKA